MTGWTWLLLPPRPTPTLQPIPARRKALAPPPRHTPPRPSSSPANAHHHNGVAAVTACIIREGASRRDRVHLREGASRRDRAHHPGGAQPPRPGASPKTAHPHGGGHVVVAYAAPIHSDPAPTLHSGTPPRCMQVLMVLLSHAPSR
jgi:hypothetical protein